MAVIATALGVVNAPRSQSELRSRLRGYRPELRSSSEARDAARYLLLTPPLPIVVRPAYGLLAAAAVSLMPAWTRVPLRLPWLPVSERALVRPAGATLVKTLRWALAPTAPR